MVDNICSWKGKTLFAIQSRPTKTGEHYALVKLKYRHKRLTATAFGLIAEALNNIDKDTNLSIIGNIADRECRKCRYDHPSIIITDFSLDGGETWHNETTLSGGRRIAEPMSVNSLIKHRHNTAESVQSEMQDLESMGLERYFEREPDELPDPEHDFVNDQPW